MSVNINQYVPKVSVGLGSAATGLGTLATAAAAIASAYQTDIGSTGTLTFTGVSAFLAFAFHYIRGSQAGKIIENTPVGKFVERELAHFAPAVEQYAPEVAAVVEKVAAAVPVPAAPVAPPADPNPPVV